MEDRYALWRRFWARACAGQMGHLIGCCFDLALGGISRFIDTKIALLLRTGCRRAIGATGDQTGQRYVAGAG